jgi:hypothetical protein
MIRKFKKLLVGLAVFGLAAAPVALPAVAYAQPPPIEDPIGMGLEMGTCFVVNGELVCPTPEDAEARINHIITMIINIFSLIVGVVSVIMIIIGGLKYITSGGDTGNVTGAKNTILYAIIGLVIVAMAQFLVRFVLGRLTE